MVSALSLLAHQPSSRDHYISFFKYVKRKIEKNQKKREVRKTLCLAKGGRAVTIWLQNKERLWNHEKAGTGRGIECGSGDQRTGGVRRPAAGQWRTGGRQRQLCTYVPLRTITEALRPDAEVDWVKDRAVVRAEGLKLTARPGDAYIEANGRTLYAKDGVHLKAGRTLVPVRVLAEALGATVDWNPATGVVSVNGGGSATTQPDYNREDKLYWLSRIISAESRGEPLEGQIAVGNVVLNRVDSPDFPDTIYGVIFDDRWGGQFTPVRNGTIYQEPTEQSIQAANLCLEGVNVAKDSLYFLAPALTNNHWIMENRTHVMTIGAHWFYR